jgi:co-chaperonin GroES (HSP10)
MATLKDTPIPSIVLRDPIASGQDGARPEAEFSPAPKFTPVALGEKLVVRHKYVGLTKTEEGLILPAETAAAPAISEVVSIGVFAKEKLGGALSVGDLVAHRKQSGAPVPWFGETLTVLMPQDVLFKAE